MEREPIKMRFTFVYETLIPTNPEELEVFVSEAKEQLEEFSSHIDEKLREHLLIAAEKFQAGEYTREGNSVRISFEEEKFTSEAVQA